MVRALTGRAAGRCVFAFIVAASIVFGAACRKKVPPPGAAKEGGAAAAEGAVPAPADIMAEGVVRSPDAILASLRVITPLAPDRIGPLVADMFHVGKEVGNEVDGSKPVHFVVIRGAAATEFVIAASLSDPSKAKDALAKQSLQKSEDAGLGLTIYEGTETPKTQVIGVRRSWLLAASTVDALKQLAPYATRTLPTRALPKEEAVVTLPQSAVRTTVHDRLKELLDTSAARRAEALAKARAAARPGFLDAIAEYSARQNARFLGWLSDSGDVRVTLSTSDGALSLRGEMAIPDPASALGRQVAAWPVGDATAVLAMPASAVLAASGRSNEATRAEASADFGDVLAAIFPREVGAAEKTKISEFFAAWDQARGKESSAALVYEGPTKIGVVARLAANDPVALAKMTKDALTATLAMKGVESGLAKQGISRPTLRAEWVAGVDATVLTFTFPRKPGEKPKPGEPDTAEVIWGVSGGELVMAAGVGARELLARVVEAKGAGALEGFADLTRALKELGGSLAGSAVLLPSRLISLANGATAATSAAQLDPVILAFGKGATTGPYLTLDLTRPAVELAMRLVMGNVFGAAKRGSGGPAGVAPGAAGGAPF